MTNKQKAHELAVEIHKLQKHAAEIPIFTAGKIIKSAALKQAEFNQLIFKEVFKGE
jgi:hypothetical protein